MADALWIDETYLMENSVIYDNVDMKIITPSILFAQKAHIKPILGTKLFDVIQAEINLYGTATASYSTRVRNLLTQLKDVLLYRVMEDATSEMVYKWMNKGIVIKTGENVQTSTQGMVEFIQNKNRIKAELFENRVRDYLIRYESTYPELNTNTEADEIQPARSWTARTGIFLEDDNDECDYKRGHR